MKYCPTVLYYLFIISILSLAGCSASQLTIVPTELNPTPGRGLRLSDTGSPLCASWIGYPNDTIVALQYAIWQGDQWSEPQIAARGDRRWHINDLDAPVVAPIPTSDQLIAGWMVGSSRRNPYDHHIIFSRTSMNAVIWSPPQSPYTPSVPAYYGLLQMAPLPEGKTILAWQDGRTTKYKLPRLNRFFTRPDSRIHLYSAELDADGTVSNEQIIDTLISQLCPLDMASTSKGALIAYRNHQAEDVKEIVVRQYRDGNWQPYTVLGPDRWSTNYPTTEGPRITAGKKHAAVVWYAAPEGQSKIQMAASSNHGKSFKSPVIVDSEQPVGKADVCLLDRNRYLVSWVGQGNRLLVAELNKRGKIYQTVEIAQLPPGEVVGSPCISAGQGGAVVSWQTPEGLLRTAHIKKEK